MWVIVICLLTLIVFIVIRTRRLTVAGGIGGGVLALIIYAGAGLAGVSLLACFFVLGTFATSWSHRREIKKQSAEDDGPRKLSQVLANGGVAGLLATIAIVAPEFKGILILLIACSFSSATADTLSSELGSLYGRRFFNIITLQPDTRGEDGVVSLHGFFIGIGGSCLIAILYLVLEPVSYWSGLIIIVSGTVGNISDSVAGALFERKGFIKNDVVNLINTITATCIGWLMTAIS